MSWFTYVNCNSFCIIESIVFLVYTHGVTVGITNTFLYFLPH